MQDTSTKKVNYIYARHAKGDNRDAADVEPPCADEDVAASVAASHVMLKGATKFNKHALYVPGHCTAMASKC